MSKYQKKSDGELKRTLTKLQYDVTQNAHTEPPYTNEYNRHYEKGIYVDITSGHLYPHGIEQLCNCAARRIVNNALRFFWYFSGLYHHFLSQENT